jgi:hypothetical protein
MWRPIALLGVFVGVVIGVFAVLGSWSCTEPFRCGIGVGLGLAFIVCFALTAVVIVVALIVWYLRRPPGAGAAHPKSHRPPLQ